MTRMFLFGTMILAMGGAAKAQSSVSGSGAAVRKNLEYLEPGRSEKLDLYLPAPGVPRRGGVVWIHGGSWIGGFKDASREIEIGTTLANAGYVCASVEYKLGEGAWPQNLLDCKNAVRYLRIHAREMGFDPDRIAVGGGSAGGHLALMVAFTSGVEALEPLAPYAGVSSEVRCVFDLYGVPDLLKLTVLKVEGTPEGREKLNRPAAVFGGGTEREERWRKASPLHYLRAGLPPVLILHGLADDIVDPEQSRELARRLAALHVPHEMVLVEGIGHTFDLETWNKQPLPRDLRPVVLAFLEQHLAR